MFSSYLANSLESENRMQLGVVLFVKHSSSETKQVWKLISALTFLGIFIKGLLFLLVLINASKKCKQLVCLAK